MKRARQSQRLAVVVSLDSRRATRTLMHCKEPIACQLLAFPSKRMDQRRPRVRRNATALLPLFDSIPAPADISGHRGERLPGAKHIVNRSHARDSAPDELSGQGPLMNPMTVLAPIRTMCPMGRGTTPVRFRAEMAKRLRSARVVAGYATQKQAADALRIGLDRYEKWESGRTPIPAQYIGAICGLYGVDANYLYNIESRLKARETA